MYGTAFTYCGNRDAAGNPEELFLLHPRDVEVKLVTEPGPEYGDIEYYNYTYGGYTFKSHLRILKFSVMTLILGNSTVTVS